MRSKILLELQTYVTLAIAAHLVAYLLVRGVSYQYLAAFLVAFAALLVAMTLVRESSGARSTMDLEKVKALPTEEAKRRAEDLLADPAKFRCVVSRPEDAGALGPLAPILKSFFERYESVESVAGETRLARAEIGTSSLNPRFIKIGSDIEHTEVVARPGKEDVYQIDGTEPPDYRFQGHPTIHHWILRIAEDLYSEDK